MNKNQIILILLILIIFCCLFQQTYNNFYKHPFMKEGFNNNLNKSSLGNYNIPAKYVLFDMSRNKNSNILNSIEFYLFTNGNIEKIDLGSISTIKFVDDNLEILKEQNQYKIKVGSSEKNSKTIDLPYEDMKVDDVPINNSSKSKFKTSIKNNKLTIKRDDSTEGWDDELYLMGYYKDSSKEHENNLDNKLNSILSKQTEKLTLEGENKKILLILNKSLIKLSSLDKIILKSDDESFQDTLLSISFYDESKNLISTINTEVIQEQNKIIPYKKFVFYNQSYYENKLPIDYLFNSEYSVNNTYFKSFLYENKELLSDIKCNNSTCDLAELNAYYNSNDYKNAPTTLSSYYSKMNQEENIINPNLEISSQLKNNELINNDDTLSDLLEKVTNNSNTNTNYKNTYSKLSDNTNLNTYQSSNVKYTNGQYLSNNLSNENSSNDNSSNDNSIYSNTNGYNIFRGQYYLINEKK